MLLPDDSIARRLARTLSVLGPLWTDARPLLDHGSCFQLLCSVILSAQCSDDQVNRVSPALFARWPDALAMTKADIGELESTIKSLGFWRTKAKHLSQCAGLLVQRHECQVPDSMEALLELPGVGRKTANLVLSSCFGKPGIIVDTHVLRVAKRLGIAAKGDPALVEKIIAANVADSDWTRLSHAINRHGKFVCRARQPDCDLCPLTDFCPKIEVQPRKAGVGR